MESNSVCARLVHRDSAPVRAFPSRVTSRNESVSPPIEGLENTEYDMKEDALKAAWQLKYGPTANLHIKVAHIEGPNGERIGPEEIAAWFEARSAIPR